MRLAANLRTGKKTLLRSWKSVSDPSIGSFSAGIDPSGIPQFLIWNGSRPIWRSGPWNNQVFIGVPEMNSVYLDGFNLADDRNGGFTLSLGLADESDITNFVLSSEGKFGQVFWDDRNEGSWDYRWATAQDECDVYGKNWTNGCVRRTATLCERTQNDGQVPKEDGFSKLERVKVPDFAEWSSSITEQKCMNDCLNNCSCIAYAYYSGISCMLWRGNLTDIKKFSSGGADLYIRLAYTELDNKKINLKLIISLTVVGGAIAIAISVFYSWRWIAEYKERKRKNKQVFLSKTKGGYPLSSDENIIQDNFNRVKLQELPMFNLQMLSAATDNFDNSNKLGQGGFGPVYKAWKLWNQGNIAALVDPGISYPFHEEIFRCVHVGLLCVQEFAKDRPAIFTVISMLKSEIVDLPTPKQPAFSERRGELDTESFQHDPRPESINNVTVTLLSAR
ncbi:hypothetical protein DKX38_017007 [Salix brachista]|uniref:Apple domain-containing protein n=1 Tax=Salix brachista TaxID=2182728 RepID=A0A5N5KUX0_9ROSI|nr:hypothetical protein DKX38_017007 [Salix brachista]